MHSENTVPQYIRDEAKRFSDTVLSRKNENTFTVLTLCDMHMDYYTDPDNLSVKDCAAASVLAADAICPDMVAILGDISIGGINTTREETFDQFDRFHEMFAPLTDSRLTVEINGNHDDAPYQGSTDKLTKDELYEGIAKRNLRHDVVTDENDPNGGCGYLDIESQKVRVIYLNTHERQDWGSTRAEKSSDVWYLNTDNISGAQTKFFAEKCLDFSGKPDPSEWSILVLSHCTLNLALRYVDPDTGITHPTATYYPAVILAAYRTGGKGHVSHDGYGIDYDFSKLEKRANVICDLHGHTHSYSDEMIGGEDGQWLSICMPSAGYDRERPSSDGVTYAKTHGTKDSTSFCAITVDKKKRHIWADHYGAGFDREYDY